MDVVNDVMELDWHETHDEHDMASEIMKKVHIEVSDFARTIDLQAFLDWLAALERNFDWYDMLDETWVWFAIMKVVGQAQIW